MALAAVLFVVVWQSSAHLSRHEAEFRPTLSVADEQLGAWLWYDSSWYHYIADNGYDDAQVALFEAGEQSAVAFFPGYPAVVRAFDLVTHDVGLAQIAVTFLSGLACAVLFWTWSAAYVAGRARRVALLLFIGFPYAYYLYGTGYSDALYIALVLAAFVLLDRDRPLAAGVVAALATATRSTGLALVVGLVAVTLERRGTVERAEPDEATASRWRRELARWSLHRGRLRPRDLGVLVGALGFVGYAVFLWRRTGDPLAFASVQEAWGQASGPRTWSKVHFVGNIVRFPFSEGPRLAPHGLLAVACLALLPSVAKRVGWGYAAYCATVLAFPLYGSATMMGTARYLLETVPVFVAAAALLEQRPALRWRVPAVSVVLLVVATSLFARGFYLS